MGVIRVKNPRTALLPVQTETRLVYFTRGQSKDVEDCERVRELLENGTLVLVVDGKSAEAIEAPEKEPETVTVKETASAPAPETAKENKSTEKKSGRPKLAPVILPQNDEETE